MAAGRQQTRELADCLMRIFNVFETFEASNVLEFTVRVRQRSRQIAATHLDVSHHENFRVQVARLHLESRLGKARRKRSLARGNVQQFTSRQWVENSCNSFVNFWPCDRSRRAAIIMRCVRNLLLSRRAQSFCSLECGR